MCFKLMSRDGLIFSFLELVLFDIFLFGFEDDKFL